ncbi:MAG: Flp family type IVb pilin [Sphingomonadales bacterium]
MRGIIKKLRRNTWGATAVEYGLIVALIAVAAIASLQTLGVSMSDFFGFVSTKLDEAEEA